MGGMVGKEIEKGGDICIHVADPVCCAAENNTTLQSSYPPIENKYRTRNFKNVKKKKRKEEMDSSNIL